MNPAVGFPGTSGTGARAGAWQAPEPTEFMLQNAIQQIYAANTEQDVINAAVGVFTPTRDLADKVADAIELRVAQLRTPPGWTHRLPPPLPSYFDAGRAVEAAYYGQPTASFMAATPAATPPAGMGMAATHPAGMGMAATPPAGMGMRIAARRPGNLPRSRTRSSRFQPRRPAPALPQYPEWTPPANTMKGWVNPFLAQSSALSAATSNPSQSGTKSLSNPSQTGTQSLSNPNETGLMSLLDLLMPPQTGTGVTG